MIFLIKTTIVEPQQMADAGDAAEAAIRNKRIGARNGLLPWSNDKLVASNLLTAREALAAGDRDKALWHTNLALYISPTAADALAMKQEVTGERIAYHDRSQLDDVFDAEMQDGLLDIRENEPVPPGPPRPGADPRHRRCGGGRAVRPRRLLPPLGLGPDAGPRRGLGLHLRGAGRAGARAGRGAPDGRWPPATPRPTPRRWTPTTSSCSRTCPSTELFLKSRFAARCPVPAHHRAGAGRVGHATSIPRAKPAMAASLGREHA